MAATDRRPFRRLDQACLLSASASHSGKRRVTILAYSDGAQALTSGSPWTAACAGVNPPPTPALPRGRRSADINPVPQVIIAAASFDEHMQLAEEVLRDSGAVVTVSVTTEFARAASATNPDMVVLELGRRGWPALRMADVFTRAIGKRPPAIVFISREACAHDQEAASEYGPVIDAPIDPLAFAHLVRDLHRERLAALGSPERLHQFSQRIHA